MLTSCHDDIEKARTEEGLTTLFCCLKNSNEQEDAKRTSWEKRNLALSLTREPLHYAHATMRKNERTLLLKYSFFCSYFLREHKENFQLTQFMRPLIILVKSSEKAIKLSSNWMINSGILLVISTWKYFSKLVESAILINCALPHDIAQKNFFKFKLTQRQHVKWHIIFALQCACTCSMRNNQQQFPFHISITAGCWFPLILFIFSLDKYKHNENIFKKSNSINHCTKHIALNII